MSRKLAFRIPQSLSDLVQWASQLNAFMAPLAEQPQTFTAGDTTPSVLGAEYFEFANSGATSVTNFDDGVKGQVICLKLDANTTIVHDATKIKLAKGANITGTADDLLVLRCGSDGIWREESFASDTAIFAVLTVLGIATLLDDVKIAAAKKLFVDGGGDTYLYEVVANVLSIVAGGTAGALNVAAGGISVPSTNRVYFDGGSDTYLVESSSDKVTAVAGGLNAAQFDNNNTAAETRFLVGVGGGIGLQRVTLGAADSGGVGFKVLRVPN